MKRRTFFAILSGGVITGIAAKPLAKATLKLADATSPEAFTTAFDTGTGMWFDCMRIRVGDQIDFEAELYRDFDVLRRFKRFHCTAEFVNVTPPGGQWQELRVVGMNLEFETAAGLSVKATSRAPESHIFTVQEVRQA